MKTRGEISHPRLSLSIIFLFPGSYSLACHGTLCTFPVCFPSCVPSWITYLHISHYSYCYPIRSVLIWSSDAPFFLPVPSRDFLFPAPALSLSLSSHAPHTRSSIFCFILCLYGKFLGSDSTQIKASIPQKVIPFNKSWFNVRSGVISSRLRSRYETRGDPNIMRPRFQSHAVEGDSCA